MACILWEVGRKKLSSACPCRFGQVASNGRVVIRQRCQIPGWYAEVTSRLKRIALDWTLNHHCSCPTRLHALARIARGIAKASCLKSCKHATRWATPSCTASEEASREQDRSMAFASFGFGWLPSHARLILCICGISVASQLSASPGQRFCQELPS